MFLLRNRHKPTPEPSGASGSACCRRTRLRNGSARSGNYGEGEAGTAREREDGYALFWQTVMAAAPTYDHLASYDIHVRGRKRYEADPHSFVEAGRAWSRIVFERCGAGVFPDEDRYRMLGLFSRLPAWCDPPTGVPPSPRLLDDMGTPPAAGPELP